MGIKLGSSLLIINPVEGNMLPASFMIERWNFFNGNLFIRVCMKHLRMKLEERSSRYKENIEEIDNRTRLEYFLSM